MLRLPPLLVMTLICVLGTGCPGGGPAQVTDAGTGGGGGDGDGDGDGDGGPPDGGLEQGPPPGGLDAGSSGDGDGDGDGEGPTEDAVLCMMVRDTFEAACQQCDDVACTEDVWFNASACASANDDGYDNTVFYECLVTAFGQTDNAVLCEEDDTVRQFEDTSISSDPPGCREYFNATLDNPPEMGAEGEQCLEVLSAFEAAKELCMDTVSNPDVWFNEAACAQTDGDDYDNTAFYSCLLQRFGQGAEQVCDESGRVYQFENISSTAIPPGCRELYNSMLIDSGGPDGPQELHCEQVLGAFEAAAVTCMDASTTPDPWFSQSTCEQADGDGYDNTEFYECLLAKFGQGAEQICDENGFVQQFEDISQSSDPAGCRELYNSVEE